MFVYIYLCHNLKQFRTGGEGSSTGLTSPSSFTFFVNELQINLKQFQVSTASGGRSHPLDAFLNMGLHVLC